MIMQSKHLNLISNSLKKKYHIVHWRLKNKDLNPFSIKPTIQVYFYPNYSRDNPYQLLLYSACKQKGIRCTPSKIEDVVSSKMKISNSIFHLHWTAPILRPAKNQTDAINLKNEFIHMIDKFKKKGGKFIWTIHNILPYNASFENEEVKLRKEIIKRADKIHIHSSAALTKVEGMFPISKDKSVIINHGNYIGVYPNKKDRENSKRKLGIDKNDFVFLYFGQIRPNKGLSNMIKTFHDITNEEKNIKLIIAGKPKPPLKSGDLKILVQNNRNIILHEKYIKNRDIQSYFNASDIVILPFENVLTSGSVMLALSFSRPVIVPNIDTLREVIKDSYNGWIYNTNKTHDLKQIIKKCLGYDRQELIQFNKNAFDMAFKYDWLQLSLQLVDKIHSLCT